MKIAARHSHQNGWEFIQVHKPQLWNEIATIVASVDATACKIKLSKERRLGKQAEAEADHAPIGGMDRVIARRPLWRHIGNFDRRKGAQDHPTATPAWTINSVCPRAVTLMPKPGLQLQKTGNSKKVLTNQSG